MTITLSPAHAFAKAAALAVAATLLASCYLPVRFDSEITLDRAGYYDLKFDGYLADVTLYDGLRKGEIEADVEKEKVAVIERDFTRDPSTKAFEYYRDGIFKVTWENEGDLIEAKTVTFVRRNELILQLKYVSDTGYIVLEGKSIKQENRQRLADIGLNMQGQIRLKTALPIKDHNATRTQQDPNDPGAKWLVWDIKDIMSPRPRAIFIVH